MLILFKMMTNVWMEATCVMGAPSVRTPMAHTHVNVILATQEMDIIAPVSNHIGQ